MTLTPKLFKTLPSPPADTIFVLNILEKIKHTQFFNYTHKSVHTKSEISLHKLDHLCTHITFLAYPYKI